MTKHKHLTLSDRNDIQLGLERDETFKTIEQFILKDPTTVSKERKKTNETDKSESLAIIIFLSLYSMRLPLFVIGGLKEGKTVVIKKYSTVESREGTPLNSQTFWDMDKVISDGGKKG